MSKTTKKPVAKKTVANAAPAKKCASKSNGGCKK